MIDTVFLQTHHYKGYMSNKFFQIKGLISAMSGPWDNNNSSGDENPKPSSNPWNADNVEQLRPKKKPSLEEMFRGGGLGGGFGGGLPTRPNGKPLWPLALVALIALWIFWTSVHRLEPAESGVVTTFGSYTRTIGSGVSFSAPYPIQNVEKVNTNEVRTLTIGAPNADDKENLILTRDQNVINMAYNVRWQVGSPELFLFQLQNPEETVSEVAESAMRAAIANFDLIQAIGPGRSAIQADVRERMQVILDEYNSGIFVQSIDIQQAAAPSEVREAFNAVNAAKQNKEAALNDARKYARQLTERALGDTAQFDRIYEQYALAPQVTRRRLYYETMEQILAGVDKTILESDNVTPFLPLPEIKRRVDRAAQEASKPSTEQAGGN